MKRPIVVIAILISLFGTAIFINKATETPMEIKGAVTVHKTATCGCCANYIGYLRTSGYEVTIVNHNTDKALSEEKRKLGVPESLDSCHTTVFDTEKYFVEGHIPLEAVDKLLAEKPDLMGIGMPGMPSASPGMPGKKTESFNISKIAPDGTVSNYLTI